MNSIMTIAWREFRSLFLSPLAWSILAILQFILAYLFLSDLDGFNSIQSRLSGIDGAPGLTDLVIVPLYSHAAILLMLLTPLLTMRLICQERRNKTLVLLLASPISNTEIIIGKFLGVLGLLILLIMLISLMPLSLLLGGTLDFGKLASNLFGIILLVSTFTALGVLMSSLATHPTIAAFSSYGVLIFLWVADVSFAWDEQANAILQAIALLPHFQNFQSALISSADVAYFILVTTLMLKLSIHQLEKERLQA